MLPLNQPAWLFRVIGWCLETLVIISRFTTPRLSSIVVSILSGWLPLPTALHRYMMIHWRIYYASHTILPQVILVACKRRKGKWEMSWLPFCCTDRITSGGERITRPPTTLQQWSGILFVMLLVLLWSPPLMENDFVGCIAAGVESQSQEDNNIVHGGSGWKIFARIKL